MSKESTERSKGGLNEDSRPDCGIVMPISPIDGCPESHWKDVRLILDDAIERAGYKPKLVSDADDSGIIQARIVTNLAQNPIVVCDLSAKNPNVMFEVGLRLAFDMPTVLIKDDLTSFAFDTSVIEQIEYPRSLRFQSIVEFKEKLITKIVGTAKAKKDDPDYSTFLKHFQILQAPKKLETMEISGEALMTQIQNLTELLRQGQFPESFRNPILAENTLEAVTRYFIVNTTRGPVMDVLKRIGLSSHMLSNIEIRERSPKRVEVRIQSRSWPLIGHVESHLIERFGRENVERDCGEL